MIIQEDNNLPFKVSTKGTSRSTPKVIKPLLGFFSILSVELVDSDVVLVCTMQIAEDDIWIDF